MVSKRPPIKPPYRKPGPFAFVGCLVMLALAVGGTYGAVQVVRGFLVANHQAAPVAAELGFERGSGDYGTDGWYLRRREGRLEGVAAIFRRHYAVFRLRQLEEASQVAVWADLPPMPTQAMTLGGKVLAAHLTEGQQQAMGEWVATHHEDLVIANADELSFADHGVAVVVTWDGAMPVAADVEHWLDALRPLARALERAQR